MMGWRSLRTKGRSPGLGGWGPGPVTSDVSLLLSGPQVPVCGREEKGGSPLSPTFLTATGPDARGADSGVCSGKVLGLRSSPTHAGSLTPAWSWVMISWAACCPSPLPPPRQASLINPDVPFTGAWKWTLETLSRPPKRLLPLSLGQRERKPLFQESGRVWWLRPWAQGTDRCPATPAIISPVALTESQSLGLSFLLCKMGTRIFCGIVRVTCDYVRTVVGLG